MADQQPNNSGVVPHVFSGGMKKNFNDLYTKTDMWVHAVNAVNNSHDGELGVLGNEPANRLSTRIAYTLIGAIPMTGDKWVVFSTNDENSEIGVFDDSTEKYVKVVNDNCLGFKRSNLITGACKRNYDCTHSVYFADGLNPDRMLNLDKVPYIEKEQKKTNKDSCFVPIYTDALDCEKIRIARIVSTPKLKLTKSAGGGNLPNGSYQVVVSYTINQLRITDYFLPSNIQSLFDHNNMTGALEVEVEEMDQNFDEFELVVIRTVNQQAQAKRIGVYSTRQKTIVIDQIRESLVTVPIESIPLQTPAYDRSDALFEVNDYLLRVGPSTKPDFNYQPYANKIRANWVAVEVAANYYHKGGNLVTYMRDEVYAFFIRWVYNTGEKSANYLISGRKPDGNDTALASGNDVFEAQLQITDKPMQNWQVENTAKITSTQVYAIPEGQVIMEGVMGYYESTEKYDDRKPNIWGELCGVGMRFHKMPDSELVPLTTYDGRKMVLLGVKFDNIEHPVGNDGKKIKSIVGYEIMRASREGNRSIVAKGILSNAGQYMLPNEVGDTNPSNDVLLGSGYANEEGMVGLYSNFPFNDLNPNSFLSSSPVSGGCQSKGYAPLTDFSRDVFTFHSPETNFKNPFLNPTELKIHGEIYGQVKGSFDPVYKHPKSKLIRDFALVVAGLAGVGTGLLALIGKKTTTLAGPKSFNLGLTVGGASNGTSIGAASVPGYYGGTGTYDTILQALGFDNVTALLGNAENLVKVAASNTLLVPPAGGGIGGALDVATESTPLSALPIPLRILGGVPLFTYYFSQGTDAALRIIKAMIPYQQYGWQYNAHGFYNQFKSVKVGNRRRYIEDATYLQPYLQEFAGKYRVNNLHRQRQVMLKLHRALSDPSIKDNSRTTIGELGQWDNPKKPFNRLTSAYYASMKVPMRAQYGQLESMIILPVSTCTHASHTGTDARFTSPVLFNGDVYINRYSEKNIMPMFNEWMHDMPNGTVWDYRSYYNLPYPRYWMDSTTYEVSNLTSALIRLNFRENVLPNDFAHLDRPKNDCTKKVSFSIDKAFFYLFVNGVRDFFVESEINLAHRDWGEKLEEKHFDINRFTDLTELFRSDIIKSGNHYKYDLSLSASRLVNNFISWGSVLPRDYDPLVSTKCYSYYPKRVLYSLPQQDELKKDNWISFLANNYKDFAGQITTIHQIDKRGAMIFFEDRAPVQFVGVDQLQTEAGVKLSIGDGGLFNQTLGAIVSADHHYEYGAAQNRLGVINTPAGLFFISQKQGKLFQYSGQLKNIGDEDLKFWLNEHLPSKLLKQFPHFELNDNPVIGVGCQAIYDSFNDIVYFTKKDYQLKSEHIGSVTYAGGAEFRRNGRIKVPLTDTEYFEDAGWTLSYDVKSGKWISYHDWKPDYVLGSTSHFYTVKGNGLWKHNDRCDLFCNFYGVDYPFEVEFPVITGNEVSTLRSVEYQLESYRYLDGCSNRQHLLDHNFDRAMIVNSEQSSGMLKLLPRPKNNPFLMIENPQINISAVDTYYSKEENKYRINQFFDLTRNRGEFGDNLNAMWLHEANGYRKTINPRYINYSKNPTARKRFRHYANRIILRRVKSDNVKMLLTLVNTKQLKSAR